MKCLSELEEFLAEELQGACAYATMALKYKGEDDKLADAYYAMSKIEVEHATLLWNHMDRIRTEQKITSDGMWDWYHEKLKKQKANVLAMIGMYK